jgi:large subunit ribosomal protein L9
MILTRNIVNTSSFLLKDIAFGTRKRYDALTMKVVLIKDVRKMGRVGEVVEVSDGHAINFIIPQKMGIPATPANLKQAEMKKQHADEMKAVDSELITETLKTLSEGRTVITKKANDKNHLYDAVDAAEIAAATKLPVEAIKLEKPIKEVGEFDVPVSMGANFGTVKIVIEAE